MFDRCDDCTAAFGRGYGLDLATTSARRLLRLYGLVYAVDMALYLEQSGHTAADARLLDRLYHFLRDAA